MFCLFFNFNLLGRDALVWLVKNKSFQNMNTSRAKNDCMVDSEIGDCVYNLTASKIGQWENLQHERSYTKSITHYLLF